MDLFWKSVMQDMSFRGVDQVSIICLQLLRSYCVTRIRPIGEPARI